MSEHTKIEYADSSVNAMMGCAGCELWNPVKGVKKCYAGTMTQVYQGRPGWPLTFEDPKIFPERIDKAVHWKSLIGKARPDKPWLDGMPRVIFLNDMGDTFTEGLDPDWLAPYLDKIAHSPHIWLLLTKRPSRMLAFSLKHPLPPNIWPGTSITSPQTFPRVFSLMDVKGGGPKWISAEPLWAPIDIAGPTTYPARINWVVVGGESGADATITDINWIRFIVQQCKATKVPCFVKQLGSNVVQGDGEVIYQSDAKGGDEFEFPEDLHNCREMPEFQMK